MINNKLYISSLTPTMKMFSQFPNFRQLDKMDCGPTCLKIICSYYGANYNLDFLRTISGTNKKGVFVGGLLEALDHLKMDAMPISIDFEKLKKAVPFPCIIHWQHDHYMVVYKISKLHVYTSNPKVGLIKYSHNEFIKGWIFKSDTKKGTVILARPRVDFDTQSDVGKDKTHVSFIFNYFKPYKKLVYQLLFGLFVGLAIELTLPFLTQSVVDFGINYNDLSFVKLILFAQLFIYLTQAAIEMIRSWILLHITTRVNIQIISDYILILLGMPIAFFETKTTGDFIQRMQDHSRVSNFLSANSLLSLSGVLEILLFGIVLLYFNLNIFITFFIGTFIYFIWHSIFLKRREQLDHLKFEKEAENKSKIIQLIDGVSEIKFNASQRRRRSEWYQTQTELFQHSIQSLRINQLQLNGGRIINESKNILMLFIAASAVISGSITLGTMLAVMFIIAALNGPLYELIQFSLNFQDAKLSFDRISEIHNLKPESKNFNISEIPKKIGVIFKDVNFSYPGTGPRIILNNINCTFPIGKTTAIVGSSGSGKTTLLKLLLKVHKPTEGDIFIDNHNLNSVGSELWRKQCGVVLQDGYLFNDTIQRNITESDSMKPINIAKYNEAIRVSNLNSLINGLPMGDETLIHNSGSNISGGEFQRILIARAVYKNPSFLFFDEATSSLDSKNESEIIKNLNDFYKDRTVIIIAHRLSTVKNADQIIVMEGGSIVETGKHEDLINKKGVYYELVMKQL